MLSRLLDSLKLAINDAMWDEHPELLLWILCIGGAFAPEGRVRNGYIDLLRHSEFGLLKWPWPAVHESLRRFIWSDKAFAQPARAFWEDTLRIEDLTVI